MNMVMAKGKIVGHYVNSILAKREAITTGFDEAILLDAQGYVSEASGENIFVVRDGAVSTPPLGSRDPRRDHPGHRDPASCAGWTSRSWSGRSRATSSTSPTRSSCAAPRPRSRPVREIDGRTIGAGGRGPIGKRIQDRYFQVVRGIEPPDPSWLTYV